MNNKQLDCFVSVSDLKNFSQASQVLFLTQSVVSYQISTLEKELGFPLFIRDTHNVKLTRAGESFYQDIMQIRDEYNEAVANARRLDREEKNTLRIGWQIFEASSLLGALISACHEKLHGTQLELSTEDGSDYLENLVNQRKDLVFVYKENLHDDDRVKFVPLWEVTNYFVINSSNPLAAKEHLEVDDLAGQVILIPMYSLRARTATEAYQCITARFPEGDVRILPDFELTAIPRVLANKGIALYPHPLDSTEFKVISRPFGHSTPMEIGIAYRSNDQSVKTQTAVQLSWNIFTRVME